METIYKKTEISRKIIITLLSAGVILSLYILLVTDPVNANQQAIIAIILAFLAIIFLLFGSITFSITKEYFKIKLGIGLIRKTINMNSVKEFKLLSNPWYALFVPGIRIIKNGVWYNISGSESIEFYFENGRKIRISSKEAHLLPNYFRQ